MQQHLKKNLKKVSIAGPGGILEGIYYHSLLNTGHVALIMHSHPNEHESTRYHGNMHEDIVRHLFYIFKLRQVSVLRLNYRGVGASEGTLQDPQHAVEDASICFDWLQDFNPSAEKFVVVGNSFGAWVAAQIAMRRPNTGAFVCVRPRAIKDDFSFLAPLSKGLMVHAGQDAGIKPVQIEQMKEVLDKKCKDSITYETIDNADNLFGDCMPNLVTTVNNFLSDNQIGVTPAIKLAER